MTSSVERTDLDFKISVALLSEHASSSNWQLLLGYNGWDHNISVCPTISHEMRHEILVFQTEIEVSKQQKKKKNSGKAKKTKLSSR